MRGVTGRRLSCCEPGRLPKSSARRAGKSWCARQQAEPVMIPRHLQAAFMSPRLPDGKTTLRCIAGSKGLRNFRTVTVQYRQCSCRTLLIGNRTGSNGKSKAWDLLEKGEIPAFAAGKLLNRTLLSLNLMPALFNLNEPDVRKRILVPAFSGAREKAKASPENVAMDATALISAEFLELLDVCFEEFDAIIIPHYALGWLLEERARIKFRQPSRVAAARELRDMIAVGHLQAFEGSNVAPERLVNEVGAPLAALLAEAASEHQDSRNRLVVRGGPVHKVSSLMEEEADLKGYEAHLCSCVSVVEMLKERGLLTDPEARESAGRSEFL